MHKGLSAVLVASGMAVGAVGGGLATGLSHPAVAVEISESVIGAVGAACIESTAKAMAPDVRVVSFGCSLKSTELDGKTIDAWACHGRGEK